MPLFTFSVDISGMARKFNAMVGATQGEALNEALLRTGGKVRSRIKGDVFGTEGAGKWPALAQSTQDRKLNIHEVALLQKNYRTSHAQNIAKASHQIAQAKAREQAIKNRIAELQRKGRDRAAAKAVKAIHDVQGKIADREAFIRSFRHRAVAAGIRDVVAFAVRDVEREKKRRAIVKAQAIARRAGHGFGDDEKGARAAARASTRRYRASEKSTRMLGGLEDSISIHLVDGKRIEIFSKARIGAIHNFGGTAGHGAKIPAREFMFLVDGDLEFLAGLLREQMIEAWVNG